MGRREATLEDVLVRLTSEGELPARASPSWGRSFAASSGWSAFLTSHSTPSALYCCLPLFPASSDSLGPEGYLGALIGFVT